MKRDKRLLVTLAILAAIAVMLVVWPQERQARDAGRGTGDLGRQVPPIKGGEGGVSERQTRGNDDAATADQCRDRERAVGEHANASAAGAASYNAGSAGASPSPTELSAEEREKAAEALEKIPQPIEMLPAGADGTAGTAGTAKFVIRDRNVSAFFTNSGFALSIVRQCGTAALGCGGDMGQGNADSPPFEKGGAGGDLCGDSLRTEEKSPHAPLYERGESQTRGWGLHWNLVGAHAVEPRPDGELPGKVNRFVGSDPAKWQTNLPTYSRMVYDDVYPGVDMIVDSRRHGMEYSFVVEPLECGDHVAAFQSGAAAPESQESGSTAPALQRIRIRIDGAQGARIADDGRTLEIDTGPGVVREERLKAYQELPSGERRKVPICPTTTSDAESQVADWS